MSTQHKERFVRMAMVEFFTPKHFGEKQIHNWSGFKIGNKYVRHSLVEDTTHGVLALRHAEFIVQSLEEVNGEKTMMIAIQDGNGNIELRRETSISLGLVPTQHGENKTNTWPGMVWVSYGIGKKAVK